MIEHQIGAYTDCAHGAGLAAISVPYYQYVSPFGLPKFARFAKTVWDVDTSHMTEQEAADAGIEKLRGFIEELGLPLHISELGATREMLPEIAKSTIPGGAYKQMNAEDILKVLEKSF